MIALIRKIAPLVALFFCRLFLIFTLSLAMAASGQAAELLVRVSLPGDFAAAHEAVVESIETEGLVVREIIPFNGLLERTAPDLGKAGSPFIAAEIVQFCSSVLAWQLLEEDVGQLALCPMSIAIFVTKAEPGVVNLVSRLPGTATAGRARGESLLRRLVAQAAELARQR